jgi:hypothetical protein
MSGLNAKAQALIASTLFADDPMDADLDRVHAALETRLAGALATTTAATTAKTASAALATKAAATSATTIAAAGATPAAAVFGGAVAVKITVLAFTAVTIATGTSAIVIHARRSPRTPDPVALAVRIAAAPPIALPVAPFAPPIALPAPLPVAVAPAPPRSSAWTDAVVPKPPEGASPVLALDEEIGLLRDARSELREGRADRALGLLDESVRRFPNGTLAEDRAAERVFVLCALNRVDESRAQALRFLADHPRSSHAVSVRTSCGLYDGESK